MDVGSRFHQKDSCRLNATAVEFKGCQGDQGLGEERPAKDHTWRGGEDLLGDLDRSLEHLLFLFRIRMRVVQHLAQLTERQGKIFPEEVVLGELGRQRVLDSDRLAKAL